MSYDNQNSHLSPELALADAGGRLAQATVTAWLQRGTKELREAQVKHLTESLESQQRGLSLQETNIEVNIYNMRLNYQMHVERLKEASLAQQREAANKKDLLDYQHALDKAWPFQISPRIIHESSVSRNNESPSLNIIICVSDRVSSEKIELLLSDAVYLISTVTMDQFQRRIILYDETRKSVSVTHEIVQATAWGLLRSESTALIYIEPRNADAIDVVVSEWATARVPKGNISPAQRVTIDLSADIADDQRLRALKRDLSMLIVAIGDTFRAIHHPYEIPLPVLPWLAKQSPDLKSEVWDYALSHYEAALDNVAKQTPLVAAEIAGQAALAAHGFCLEDMAKRLLSHGLLIFRRCSDQTAPSKLREAASTINGEHLKVEKENNKDDLSSLIKDVFAD